MFEDYSKVSFVNSAFEKITGLDPQQAEMFNCPRFQILRMEKESKAADEVADDSDELIEDCTLPKAR